MPVVLVLVADAELPAAEDEGLSNIQGTATCFPPPSVLEELIPVLLLVLLDVSDEVAPVAALPERESTANSSRPEAALTIVSLIVAICVPVDPVIWAPVNWLPRTASWPIRPVGLMCLPAQPLCDPAVPPTDDPGLVLELGYVLELPLLLDGSVGEPPVEPVELCA